MNEDYNRAPVERRVSGDSLQKITMNTIFKPLRVLVGCEYSGRVRDAFRRRGHYAMSCDVRETEAEGPHYRGDVRDVLNDGWDVGVFHPPCTRLTNAGVRWLHEPPPGKTKKQMWAVRRQLSCPV